MLDEDADRLCLLIASELVFMGKEKRNFLTKHIMWLVDDFDTWNTFPWGEYMWDKFYQMTVNVVSKHTEHHLAELKKNPNFNATYNLYGFTWAFKMRHAWFMASVDFIKGLANQDGKSLQDDEARVNCIEHNNGICGDTEVCKFLQDEEARVNVEEGDGVLDSEGDGVHLSQTNDVIQQAVNLSTMSSTSPQAINPAVAEFFSEFDALKKEVFLLKKRKDDEFDELKKRFSKLKTSQSFVMFKNLLKTDVCTENESTDSNPKKFEDMPNFFSNHNDTSNHIGRLSTEAKPSSFSSHPGNDKDASHLDDLMEIDGENVKDGYTNSQHHLHLLIKALESKTENPTLDVVVPPKDDDCILRTIKPKDAYDVVEVDKYEDDYMLMLNDKEKNVKSSLNDMELEQELDKIAVKQGILEQQPNAPKGKTTVLEETVGVKVEEKPGLGRGLGPLKVKKKNCQRALRPNYVLRSAKYRKKKLAMTLKPPFGQQSATTPLPKKIKSRIMKTKVIVPPFDLENLSRPDDCKSAKVTVPEHMCEFITNKAMPEYRFPWGKRDIVIGRSFWLSLSCLNTGKAGWLNDHVYFPVNEPKTHWCLAELEIRTGVVTFYDSVGWAGGSRRRWWRRMKKSLLEKLTVNLVMHGIFKSKGISADDYKITYNYADALF
ncbi:phospholipase-like protein [Tanacetum coccineum]